MSFSDQIKKFTVKAVEQMQSVPRGAILELFGMIVFSTPVGNKQFWKRPYAPAGYVGGRLRGNWNISTRTVDDTVTDDADRYGSSTTRKAHTAMRKFNGETTFISNHLPYARAIEEGHSPEQAPEGMVRINVRQWKRIVKRNI